MCASVLDGKTLKSVELEGGMPTVGGKKVQTKCSVMEEIKQIWSVVRNAMHFTLFFEPTAPTHVWLGCHLHFEGAGVVS